EVVPGVWDLRNQLHLIENVAVALEEPDALPGESEDVVAIGRLNHPHERLDVEALGYHRQLGNGPLERIHTKHAGSAQHGETIAGVHPEDFIVGQAPERLEERLGVAMRILLK